MFIVLANIPGDLITTGPAENPHLRIGISNANRLFAEPLAGNCTNESAVCRGMV